jgi:formylglycine-generating enzyme required for sulfatase activity
MDVDGHGCCAPSRGVASTAQDVRIAAVPNGTGDTDGVVRLPGGAFRMGTEDVDGFAGDGEGPVRTVTVDPFWIGVHAVSNADFAAFVEATGYRTEAERFGWSFVFAGFLPARLRRDAGRPPGAPWWCGVSGATWQDPEGPGSSVDERWDHPVVHVSWHDADAYCRWSGNRLPTEAEWEYAAPGGLDQRRYPWGDELTPGGVHRCNIWQGQFPTRNTAEDGYRGTAPVSAYPANGFGLHNVSGNTWEWCADRWSTPTTEQSRVMRGGSYLCHHSYCNRYRVAARTSNTPDSSSGNLGFRCARSPN